MTLDLEALPIGTVIERNSHRLGHLEFERMPEPLYWGRRQVGNRFRRDEIETIWEGVGTEQEPFFEVRLRPANAGIIDMTQLAHEIRQHKIDNPTHGRGCSCLDRHLSDARRAILASTKPLYIGTRVDPEDGQEYSLKAEDYDLEFETRLEVQRVLRTVASDL